MHRVLIIEDYDDACDMYAELLRLAGYAVECASDGVDGLEKAVTFLPDLVVLDASLPRLDGFQVARRLRRDSKTTTVPIIMISASEIPDFEGRVAEAGGNLAIRKPCLPEQLLDGIRTLLGPEAVAADSAG